jgi:hypothetical protein
MEQLITCKICFEDKDTNITTLQHNNPIGDVSDIQMCNDCYKYMLESRIIIPKMEQLITCKICFEDKVSKEDINLTGDVSDHQICIDCYKNIQKSHISKMEQLITCKICFEDKNTNITLEHINPTGDVSDHQMCGDCYKKMRVNCCPFCRCEIVIPEISKIEHKNAFIASLFPEDNNNDLMRIMFPDNPIGNPNYNILRIRAGLANGSYSN